MSTEPIKHKIIILDDDRWPDGRITENVLPELHKRGLSNQVHHYITFNQLRKDLLEGKLSRQNLFVLDSSLEREPNLKMLSFKDTIPSLISHGVKAKYMMPGSGWKEGMRNNLWFEEYIQRRHQTIKLNQMALFATGLAGDPETVVNGILAYYKEMFPGAIQKEAERNDTCSEGALDYWKRRQERDQSEGRRY